MKGWVNKVNGGIIVLARCKFHFIRVHENLLQHPIDNKSILPIHYNTHTQTHTHKHTHTHTHSHPLTHTHKLTHTPT